MKLSKLHLVLAGLLISIAVSPAMARQSEASGLFPVFENGRLGYINKAGEVVITPRFERVNEFAVEYEAVQFSEGLAGARIKGKWGFIDTNGNWVVEPRYHEIRSFSEGLAGVEIDGRWGFIDKTGRMIIEPQYSWIDGFSDGLAAVDVILADDDDGYTIGYGYIDRTGRIAIKPKFDMAYSFSEGLAPVMIKGRMGYINTAGEMVIKPLPGIASNFSEGIARVSLYGLDSDEGFMDKSGRWIVRPQFDLAGPFSGGMALVINKINDVYLSGYIDKTGKLVIEQKFKDAGSFSEGLAAVTVGGKDGYIDKTGAIVINPRFDSAETFNDGLARARLGATEGYINRSGEFVWKTSSWKADAADDDEVAPDASLRVRQNIYFPPLVFSDSPESNEFRVNWYSKHLEAMQEPPLWAASTSAETRAYRFLWLRTFHHPVVLRLDIERDGTGTLAAKVTTGKGGYEPGELRTNKTRKLTKEQVSQFLKQLEKAKFWTLPATKETVVTVLEDGSQSVELVEDGAQWIIEGLEGGKYHAVDRCAPKKSAYRDAALLLIRLSELKVKEIY